MTWQTLQTLTLTGDWSFTNLSDARYFRIRTTGGTVSTWLRQAENPSDPEFWGSQMFEVTDRFKPFKFVPPPFFTERRLALRNLDPSAPSITLQIEEFIMPLSNPAAPTQAVVSTTVNATSVAASATATSLLAANTNRKLATFWNNSTATLKLEVGASATASSYMAILEPGGYFELPIAYTGSVSGIWSAANGSALVREFV